MKVKTISLLVKLLLVALGIFLCIQLWLGNLPNATVQDIWFAISIAYGISLGTVDLNISRDSWTEKKVKENTNGNTDTCA